MRSFTSAAAAAFLLLLSVFSAPALADPLADCAAQIPLGAPQLTAPAPAHTTILCRTAYLVTHDDDRLVPLWVSYILTREHAMGCLPRVNSFAPDPDLPLGRRAEKKDYLHSGFDMGHLAPDADMSWAAAVMRQSFYLSNMTPQVPGLNRQGWERLEETVRVWATDRGAVVVIDGPIFEADVATTIGPDNVAVPSSFFKVVIDPARGEALAFIMPNVSVPKAEALAHQVTIAEAESRARMVFALPAAADRDQVGEPWPAGLSTWHQRKRSVCSSG
ncbi:MAG: endonuclease [Rhodospirillales bacterium]|jgi:endonuclease G|nr:endonuclease [Rhodospirillales bacterium]